MLLVLCFQKGLVPHLPGPQAGSLPPHCSACTSTPVRLGSPCSHASPNLKILTSVSSSSLTCLPEVGCNDLIFSLVPNLKPQKALIQALVAQRGRQSAADQGWGSGLDPLSRGRACCSRLKLSAILNGI